MTANAIDDEKQLVTVRARAISVASTWVVHEKFRASSAVNGRVRLRARAPCLRLSA